MIILGILGVLASYAIACLAFAAIFQHQKFPFNEPLSNLICALPLGPISLAWFQWVCLKFFPGLPYVVYVIIQLAPFLLLCLIFRKSLKEVISGSFKRLLKPYSRKSLTSYGTYDWPSNLVWLGGAFLLILTVTQLFGMPLMASDPLEYAALAEVIYADRSLENYPLDPSTSQGFYARSAHPPAFHMMIIYSYIWQGGADSSRLLRLIELHYMFSFVLLSALVCAKIVGKGDGKNMTMALGLLFVMATPFYVALVTAFHIDPIRIPLFMLGFVFAAKLLDREDDWRKGKDDQKVMGLQDGKLFSPPIWLTGVAIGLGMFAHSIGILLLPFVHAAYFFNTKSSFWRRCAICTVFGLVALIIGCGQYVQNIIEFGVPLHDTEPVWELPQVDHKTDVRFRRNLVTNRQRLKNGLLVWFFTPSLYGWIHQLALVSLLLLWKRIWANTMARMMLLGMLQFYALAILTMSLGVDMVIKNIRYMLTVMPFVVVFAAIGGGELYARLVAHTNNNKV